MAARSHWVGANGLMHHVLEFVEPTLDAGSIEGGQEISPLEGRSAPVLGALGGSGDPGSAPVAGSLQREPPHRGTVVLIHGYMDAAGTWDLVARPLVQAGFRVLAPDMRGFGEGPRVAPGAYYHFPDYIADVADILDGLVDTAELCLVGHSMGGGIATYVAGASPGRVSKLVLLEGFGPPSSRFDDAPERMRSWIEAQRNVRASKGQRGSIASMEEAFRRLALNHPDIAPDVLRSRLSHLVRVLEDGRVAWKFDPMHKTPSPTLFFAEYYGAFAERVDCPVLAITGGPRGFHVEDEAARLSRFRSLEHIVIEDAGHMMHWSHPALVAEHLLRFLS